MNYKFIKWIIDSLIKTYKCPSCWATINENNVDIIWAAWNSINIDIVCNRCKKHSLIKSELNDISKPMNYWPKIAQNWIGDTSNFEKNWGFYFVPVIGVGLLAGRGVKSIIYPEGLVYHIYTEGRHEKWSKHSKDCYNKEKCDSCNNYVELYYQLRDY